MHLVGAHPQSFSILESEQVEKLKICVVKSFIITLVFTQTASFGRPTRQDPEFLISTPRDFYGINRMTGKADNQTPDLAQAGIHMLTEAICRARLRTTPSEYAEQEDSMRVWHV